MPVDSFETLVNAVVALSVSNSWTAAVGEWEVTELEEDPTGQGMCICGQTGLVKLFTIRNERNGAELYPIGSVCVNLFGREDLDRQVALFSDLLALRTAFRTSQTVTLDSKLFSRAMLEYFYFQDAFTPDQWNGHDGENDYDFLLKMFNKRDKDAISVPQQKKIYMLLHRKISPFIQTDERLR